MYCLGGGNSNIFGIFTPKIGEDKPIVTSIFFKAVVQPPTRYTLSIMGFLFDTVKDVFLHLQCRFLIICWLIGSLSYRQFIATFPAAWSPQKVVNSKGIPSPKMAVTFRYLDSVFLFAFLSKYRILELLGLAFQLAELQGFDSPDDSYPTVKCDAKTHWSIP